MESQFFQELNRFFEANSGIADFLNTFGRLSRLGLESIESQKRAESPALTDDPWLNQKKAAAYCSIAPRTLSRWIVRYDIEHEGENKGLRIRRSELDRVIKGRKPDGESVST